MLPQIGLNVCLGFIKLSLADLADMQPGELLEVHWGSDQNAVVLLGEERIAEARLVTDGDLVYAEIVKLFD